MSFTSVELILFVLAVAFVAPVLRGGLRALSVGGPGFSGNGARRDTEQLLLSPGPLPEGIYALTLSHFGYGSEYARGHHRSDFTHAYDPFLAFAARCTSSFPFAFEPMQLTQIDELVGGNGSTGS